MAFHPHLEYNKVMQPYQQQQSPAENMHTCISAPSSNNAPQHPRHTQQSQHDWTANALHVRQSLQNVVGLSNFPEDIPRRFDGQQQLQQQLQQQHRDPGDFTPINEHGHIEIPPNNPGNLQNNGDITDVSGSQKFNPIMIGFWDPTLLLGAHHSALCEVKSLDISKLPKSAYDILHDQSYEQYRHNYPEWSEAQCYWQLQQQWMNSIVCEKARWKSYDEMAKVHNQGLSEETKQQYEQRCDYLREKAIEALAERQREKAEEDKGKELRIAQAIAITNGLLTE